MYDDFFISAESLLMNFCNFKRSKFQTIMLPKT